MEVKLCGLAAEFICNTNLLSSGCISGTLLGVQITLAVLAFLFGIMESVTAYWNCKVTVEGDPVKGGSMV